jgi:hypothetical protein
LRTILILSTRLPLYLPSFSFGFSSWNLSRVSIFHHACYNPVPLHPPWFDGPVNIWRDIKIMKLLIMQFSLSLLGPKSSPLRPVLKHPVYILLLMWDTKLNLQHYFNKFYKNYMTLIWIPWGAFNEQNKKPSRGIYLYIPLRSVTHNRHETSRNRFETFKCHLRGIQNTINCNYIQSKWWIYSWHRYSQLQCNVCLLELPNGPSPNWYLAPHRLNQERIIQ